MKEDRKILDEQAILNRLSNGELSRLRGGTGDIPTLSDCIQKPVQENCSVQDSTCTTQSLICTIQYSDCYVEQEHCNCLFAGDCGTPTFNADKCLA